MVVFPSENPFEDIEKAKKEYLAKQKKR